MTDKNVPVEERAKITIEGLIGATREKITLLFVDLLEAMVREAKDSIFHGGHVMHAEDHRRASTPSFSQLMQAAILRTGGEIDVTKYAPGEDPVTSFYIKLPGMLGNGFSAYPSMRKENVWAGSTYVWETTLIQRLSPAGMTYLENPFATVWLQHALTGEVKCAENETGILAPVIDLGTDTYNEICKELSKRFDADYQKGLDAQNAKLEAKQQEAMAEAEAKANAPKGVDHLLVEEAHQPAKPALMVSETKSTDDFDIGALDSLNLDDALARVDEKRSGGGEVVEASNECEGGACKI